MSSNVEVRIEPSVAESELVDLLRPPSESVAPPALGTPPSIISRMIYAGLFLIPALLIALVVLAKTGVVGNIPTQGRAQWGLAAVVLSSLTAVAVAIMIAKRIPALATRAKNVGALDAASAKLERYVLLGSLPASAGLLGVSYLTWAGVVTVENPMLPPLLAAAALLVLCAPLGYFSYANEKRIYLIEERFPDFIRDLNESYSAGLTMAQAVRVAGRGDYGLLNPEIRKMANQVSWGAPVNEALQLFADRVGTPIIQRAVALINKATRAGGNAKEVLAAAARDAREIRSLQSERRLSMTLYVIVIYVAFLVFLGVVAALQGLLVPALLGATRGVANTSGSDALAVSGLVTFTDYRLIYFSVGMVQAVGSGIVAGVMSEGRYSAGLKHAAIMSLMSVIVLGLLL